MSQKPLKISHNIKLVSKNGVTFLYVNNQYTMRDIVKKDTRGERYFIPNYAPYLSKKDLLKIKRWIERAIKDA